MFSRGLADDKAALALFIAKIHFAAPALLADSERLERAMRVVDAARDVRNPKMQHASASWRLDAALAAFDAAASLSTINGFSFILTLPRRRR